MSQPGRQHEGIRIGPELSSISASIPRPFAAAGATDAASRAARAAGLAGSRGRAIRGFLYGVSPLDPLTYGLSGAGLLAIAVLASWVPAHRASRVEPTEVMRAE